MTINTQQMHPAIQKIIDSPKMQSEIKNIGASFSLNIDQLGELYAEVRDILRGINKSPDFVSHAIERMEISREMAEKIAEELNKNLFQIVKYELQSETADKQAQTDIGRAGNFSIENDKENQGSAHEDQHIESHEDVLKAIENPSGISNNTENMLLDHFLSGPVVTVEKKTEDVVPVKPVIDDDPVPQKPKPPKGPDQYREPIV